MAAKARVQSAVRAKPWEGPSVRGLSGVAVRLPNQGKMMGTPPRMALPGAKKERSERKSTGFGAGGLPLGEVRALEVELGGAGGRGDGGADEALLVLGEGEDAGDGEVVGESFEDPSLNSVARLMSWTADGQASCL